MTAVDELLTILVACTDSIHVCLRMVDWDTHNVNPNRYFALKDYATFGVPVPSASGPSASVARQRLLAKLQEEGLLRIARRRGDKSPYAKLACKGDQQARQACGLPGLADAHAWLVKLVSLSAAAENREGTVDEYCFLADGEEATSRAMALTEEFALPAMARGWAECHSARTGLCHYWPTDAGREAAMTPEPRELPYAPVEGCRELYYREFEAQRTAMQTQKPRDPREIGPVPLLPFRTIFKPK